MVGVIKQQENGSRTNKTSRRLSVFGTTFYVDNVLYQNFVFKILISVGCVWFRLIYKGCGDCDANLTFALCAKKDL